MNHTRLYLLALITAVVAGFGGAAAFRAFTSAGAPPGAGRVLADGQRSAAEMVGQRRPDFTLGGSQGDRVSAADFDGDVVLVNFWATWCLPCREEMPMLADLHREFSNSGFQVVGIALDDVEAARRFAAELAIEYPILVGATDVMATVRRYGNVSGVLPYSALVDSDGVIRWTHLGELDRKELERRVRALL